MSRLVLLTGCSGGGKSTLLAALAARGFHVVEEPGRRIVQKVLQGDGEALPWIDLTAFARRAITMAIADHETARTHQGWTFFDRGIVDALVALEHATGEGFREDLATAYRYYERVFVTPPWPEIYASDAERRHGFEDAAAEYQRLSAALPRLGYEVKLLPKVSVTERVKFVLEQLSLRADKPAGG